LFSFISSHKEVYLQMLSNLLMCITMNDTMLIVYMLNYKLQFWSFWY